MIKSYPNCQGTVKNVTYTGFTLVSLSPQNPYDFLSSPCKDAAAYPICMSLLSTKRRVFDVYHLR